MIRRTTVIRDKDTVLRLYKSLVRPQLEYCIQVWNPHLKQDMEKLDKVQRRDTKMTQGCMTYSPESFLCLFFALSPVFPYPVSSVDSILSTFPRKLNTN